MTMGSISVIGFGKIGQAIAANVLRHGWSVTGIDTDETLVASFADQSYTTNEPGITSILTTAFADKKLIVTTDYAAVTKTDAVIIAIPLMIDAGKRVAASPFETCLRQLSMHLSGNIPVVIETSVPVGFARGTLIPALEQGGKKHGIDFLLAHSPERIKSGTMLEQLSHIPKVIGGLTDEALNSAAGIYAHFFPDELLHRVASIEAAEIVKLAGMIYRDVNIALANQIATFANKAGINYTDLIPLINTDREANLLQPGIGVGGHCTPVYPYFLIDNFTDAGLDFSLAKESRDINDGMAAYAVSLVQHKVKIKKALVLGLSFRPNVKEDALSTAYLLRDILKREQFEVFLHDTEFSFEEIKQRGFDPVRDIYDGGTEVLFLVTMHKEYQSIDFQRLYKSGIRFIVDGRNSLDREKAEAAGIDYTGIGRGLT